MCDLSEPIGYEKDESLGLYPVTNAKTASWTSATPLNYSMYEEGQFGTDASTALNVTSVGSTKRLDCQLINGPTDCMAPYTIEIVSDFSFNVDGTPKWVLSADGARPAGVPSDYISCKPKAITGAVNNSGIRPGAYPVSSQLTRLTCQLEQSGIIIDSKTYSMQHTSADLMVHTILEGYLGQSGTVLQDPVGMADMRRVGIDKFGGSLFTKSEADTTTNTMIDSMRISNGDQVKTVIEKPHLRVFPVAQNPLFQALCPTIEQLRLLPPGMQIKLMFEIRDGQERLDTGIVVSKSSDGTAGGTFTDAKVTLRFSHVVVRFQSLQMKEDVLRAFYSGRVDGSCIPLDVPKPLSNLLPTAPITRWLQPDVSVQTTNLSGQKQVEINVTTNLSDSIPPVLAVFVVKNSSFTYSGLCNTNWDMLSWAEDKIERLRCTRSGGSFEVSGFMQFLPNSDYNQNKLNESTLMHNNFAHQMFFPFDKLLYSMAEQQAGAGYFTWRQRGYSDSQMPIRAGVCLMLDSGSAIVPEMNQGLMLGTLNVVVDFTEPLSSDYSVLVVSYYRSQIVYDVKERTPDTAQPTYTVNTKMTGLTPNC